MAESEQVAAPLGASPAASPVPADRRPAPPPRRAVSARLTPLNTIVAANPSSVDDSSPVQSPAFGRPRLPGAVGTATPSNPSTPVTTPHSPAIQDIPSRPFTPPADPGSNPGSAPASPSTIRLQNRHSMMNMMKEVRKINTAPTPPVGHVRPLELPIPKPPPSNLPKSVTDDDATEKIAALAQAYRVKEDEFTAAVEPFVLSSLSSPFSLLLFFLYILSAMSWMDFKMAQAMKAQKINEDSKRVQVGKLQKGTGEKPSQIADDVMNKHAQQAQKVNSYSKAQQLSQQKGTGEKHTQVADDVLTKHATTSQKTASYAKSEQLSTQKGTGEKSAQVADQFTQHALAAQKVNSYSRSEVLAHQKGDAAVYAQQAALSPRAAPVNASGEEGGYEQPAESYDQGGYEQPAESYDQGGYEQPAESYDQGGYEQPADGGDQGYDQSAYDQSGYDQSGYDQSAYDQGEYYEEQQ
eukprot:TRINITY_DN2235_c0_g1_i4.p1 TRINITY_DN2235_c0_g1~~TRINITY_DN2235_c0_g1_i4.p1  ORF type:complete len:466 (-),score=108.95 TRINITY_DN2235_c0_g1_i4:90-1487(-)